jgi:hypothetical protein
VVAAGEGGEGEGLEDAGGGVAEVGLEGGAVGAGPDGVEARLQDAEVVGVGEGDDDELMIEAEVARLAGDEEVRGEAGDDEDVAGGREGVA